MKTTLNIFSVLTLFFILVISGCSTTGTTAKKNDVELRPEIAVAQGDEVYACNCGPKCPCNTMSKNPGKCSCGVDMSKTKVLKKAGDSADINVAGEKRSYKTKGQYACGCGPKCPCNTVSQNPGKCTCGVDMVKVN